ncbi:hypothetical protein OESDEN_09012 [Oesophagostomum dentatum]|uniref:Uncharacterized protein n=1 Tax=Oesophagostomum dentatum TaxID=61180 RepID=A0A0B1T1P6_OESDE|nr:hypothetical protein OESDEN_09012 [Oesophagostomum dentatum]
MTSLSTSYTAAIAANTNQARHERYAAHIPVNKGDSSGRQSTVSQDSQHRGFRTYLELLKFGDLPLTQANLIPWKICEKFISFGYKTHVADITARQHRDGLVCRLKDEDGPVKIECYLRENRELTPKF